MPSALDDVVVRGDVRGHFLGPNHFEVGWETTLFKFGSPTPSEAIERPGTKTEFSSFCFLRRLEGLYLL